LPVRKNSRKIFGNHDRGYPDHGGTPQQCRKKIPKKMEENGVKAFQLIDPHGLSSGAGGMHRTQFEPGGAISSGL
jgi:hypothetical protein